MNRNVENSSTVRSENHLRRSVGQLFLCATLSMAYAVSMAGAEVPRLGFRITTIATSNTKRVVSDAVVEGPEGTDFTIKLDVDRFLMNARFLTDPLDSNTMLVRTDLDTRRLVGTSERNLPLYEEDRQTHTFEVSFDEQLILLPFGGSKSDERLEIRIVPDRRPSADNERLNIRILRNDSEGAIRIDAFRIPHRFDAEIELTAGDTRVLYGTAEILFGEPTEISLKPVSPIGDVRLNGLGVRLRVDSYERSHPDDIVRIAFDMSKTTKAGRESIATGWAGAASVGGEMNYDINKSLGATPGTEYQLGIRITVSSH